jgi:hypothetical protein
MKKIIYLFMTFLCITTVSYAQTDNTLTLKEQRSGWTLLFDGNSLKGWTTTRDLDQPVPATGAGWVVADGCINSDTAGRPGDIITENEYSDFELSVDFRMTPECNSGVKYFFTRYETGGNLGMEFQILDDKLAADNKLADHLAGSFYDVLAPDESKKKVNPPGEWNTLRVVAKGKHVEHWMNGVKILEFTRGNAAFIASVADSKFNKTVPAFGSIDKGHIMLQYHGHPVSFKNVKIRTL